MELEKKIHEHLVACESGTFKGNLFEIRMMCGSGLEETIAALRKLVNQGRIEPLGEVEQMPDRTCGTFSASTKFRVCDKKFG